MADYTFRCLAVLIFFAATVRSSAASESTPPVVVGFERFFTTASTNLHEGGELLLSELRCVNCHDPGALADRIPALAGPRLDDLPNRVRFDYLIDWLANPHAVKPGTTMPDLLSGKSDQARREDATALAFYLFSFSRFPTSRTNASGSIENGRRLYHSIGCVACHAPDPAVTPPEIPEQAQARDIKFPSVPLGDLSRKYSVEGLTEFLRDPLKWRPDGRMPRTPMSEAEINDLAAYLLRSSFGSGFPALLHPPLVEKGRELYTKLGCAACHSNPDEKYSISGVKSKSLQELMAATGKGCLADSPPSEIPDFQLSALQRQAFETALQKLIQTKSINTAQRVERQMLALNCLACHERDGRGGPESGRAIFFETTGADLEDEGRFPPRLTGVGRKLLPEALERILRGEGAIRPYMTTRMPDFGAAHAESFTRLFAAADLNGKIKPTPLDGREDQVGRSSWGRELVGTTGLGCISCHDLNGHKSLGIRAADLAHAPRRLRPEWFRDYLINPAAFRPGTRMPSFWPDGKAVHPLINGNTARQIDSIRVYLTEIDQNRLPEGMEEKGSFELKPADAPIVFRTFMKDAGLHAVGVGFSQGAHVAFDAEQARWALAWRGAFLDAEGTWDDRFAPLTEPLGTNVLKFPGGAAFDGELRFNGYRLDGRGIPTFLYRADDVRVEDKIEPDAFGNHFRRTLKLHGGSRAVWFNAGSADKITARGPGVWVIGPMQLRIVEPADAPTSIVEMNGTQTLQIGVKLDSQKQGALVLEVNW